MQRGPPPPTLDTPEFRAAWSDYEAHRRERNLGALQERSVAAQFARLNAYGPGVAVEAIRITIANGWTGIFPEKVNDNRNQGAGHPRGNGAARSAQREREFPEDIKLRVVRPVEHGAGGGAVAAP